MVAALSQGVAGAGGMSESKYNVKISIILRENFHLWAESALAVKNLSKKDRENILLARDGFEAAFFQIIHFTSVEPSGRLGELVTQLMLFSAALGQLSPKAEIKNLILKHKEGLEKNTSLRESRDKKNKPKYDALKKVVQDNLEEIIKSNCKLTGPLHLKIWLATHEELKTSEEKIKEDQKKTKLPWPNWEVVNQQINTILANVSD